MASLAIFDFDRTIVDDDSDATIINRLREKKPPPEWEAGTHDWTPYMSDVSFFIDIVDLFFILTFVLFLHLKKGFILFGLGFE